VSWQRGCTNLPGGPTFRDDNTAAFGKPNFYINVTEMWKYFESIRIFLNICSEFSIDDASKVASIVWNFGPASGVNNNLQIYLLFMIFRIDGKYTVFQP
jgi:hypothetical protein